MFITVHFKEVGEHTGYCSNSAISHKTISILIVFSVNFIFQKLISSLEMAYAKHTRNIFECHAWVLVAFLRISSKQRAFLHLNVLCWLNNVLVQSRIQYLSYPALWEDICSNRVQPSSAKYLLLGSYSPFVGKVGCVYSFKICSFYHTV